MLRQRISATQNELQTLNAQIAALRASAKILRRAIDNDLFLALDTDSGARVVALETVVAEPLRRVETGNHFMPAVLY